MEEEQEGNIVDWLCSNTISDESGQAYLEDIHGVFIKKASLYTLSSRDFRSRVKQIYPNCRFVSTKRQSISVTLIYGLRWKNVNDTARAEMSAYFHSISTEEFLYVTDVLRNGNAVSFHISTRGSLVVSLFNKSIPLESLGLSSYSSLTAVSHALRVVKICRGTEGGTTLWSGRLMSDVKHGEHSSHCFGIVLSLRTDSHTCQQCLAHKRWKASLKASLKTKETPDDLAANLEDLKNSLQGILALENTDFLIDTIKNSLVTVKTQRRWEARTQHDCLIWFCRDPKMYRCWRDKVLSLPSPSTLKKMKNCLDQKPGFNTEMLRWMQQEADAQKLDVTDRVGGIIFDEMSVQEDLVAIHRPGKTTLSGQVDYGNAAADTAVKQRENKMELHLATHVLQMIYNSYGGFRFPFAYFSTREAQAPELHLLYWEAVELLQEHGFQVEYACHDGAQCNRSFMQMHFGGPSKARSMNYTVKNPLAIKKHMTFLMDPKHNLKKIRNNLLKSGTKTHHTHDLKFGGEPIRWQHWVDAYHWDVQQHSLPIHYKLTEAHLFPSVTEKMRNHLAEETLNKDMLHLMKVYSEENKQRGKILGSTIKLLEQTSQVVEMFNDLHPIRGKDDERLQKMDYILNWFEEWEKEGQTNKELMSAQTREDIKSMLSGFQQLIIHHFDVYSSAIVPGRVNSDIVENFFCQQRTLVHGANQNPSTRDYGIAVNALVLTQAPMSRKSNAFGQVTPFQNNVK